MSEAVLLVSHGTVGDLDDLAAFVTNVRRGHPAPVELVAELRRRYVAIGGASPLNTINAEIARKLAQRLGGVRVAWANRLWKPYVRDRLSELARDGVRRVVLVPLAQHSAHIYAADAAGSAREAGVELTSAPNWGQSEALCDAFASRIVSALGGAPLRDAHVVMTAHSLPSAVIDAGDPYEREVRAAAAAIASRLAARLGEAPTVHVAFQSQGMTVPGQRPVAWLGPDLSTTLAAVAQAGAKRVVLAPIGFLADHVEILYDLDIEARAMAEARGLAFARAASLNASDDLIAVLEDVARPFLAPALT